MKKVIICLMSLYILLLTGCSYKGGSNSDFIVIERLDIESKGGEFGTIFDTQSNLDLEIKFDNKGDEDYNVELFDDNDTLIENKMFIENKEDVMIVSNLKKGTYTLRIKDARGATIKGVVEIKEKN